MRLLYYNRKVKRVQDLARVCYTYPNTPPQTEIIQGRVPDLPLLVLKEELLRVARRRENKRAYPSPSLPSNLRAYGLHLVSL